jgi:hypothetical protein
VRQREHASTPTLARPSLDRARSARVRISVLSATRVDAIRTTADADTVVLHPRHLEEART